MVHSVTPPYDVEQSETYRALQTLPHFRPQAKIHPQMWLREWGDDNAESLGPSTQRIVATMCDCEYDSIGQLARMSGVAKRTVQRKLKLLRQLHMVDNDVVPTLVDDWYERLLELAPALTTFGRSEKNQIKHADDRRLHHRHMLIYGKSKPDADISQRAFKNAKNRAGELDAQMNELRQQRTEWCEQHDISTMPEIGRVNF